MKNYNIVLKQEAKADVNNAYSFYENQAKNLGDYFIIDLENTLSYISQNPKAFQKLYKSFSKIPLDVFPFIVVYEIDKKEIIIYLVFNTKQNPKELIKRLK